MPAAAYPAQPSTYRLHSDVEAAKPIPRGWCQCGCGQKTGLARDTNPERGDVRGEPVKYMRGHSGRHKAHYRETECGWMTPCWVWLGGLTPEGYGRSFIDGRSQLLHRFAYEQKHGPVPVGLELDHLCRNRACLNPDHLQAVVAVTNVRRGRAARRLGAEGAFLIRMLTLTTSLGRTEIAEMLGVDRKTVLSVVRGDTWALGHRPA